MCKDGSHLHGLPPTATAANFKVLTLCDVMFAAVTRVEKFSRLGIRSFARSEKKCFPVDCLWKRVGVLLFLLIIIIVFSLTLNALVHLLSYGEHGQQTLNPRSHFTPNSFSTDCLRISMLDKVCFTTHLI